RIDSSKPTCRQNRCCKNGSDHRFRFLRCPRKANTGKQNKASLAAMNLLVNAGIPVRTVSQYKIMHDKVIIADGRNVEVGSFNYTRAADRFNSENVLVVWDEPVVAQRYLQHWQTRWEMGKDWSSSY
ncbi:phospholipase D-like domain-containing protein, partial [Klebsiella pneumoniae subsp. pneumoniae]